MSYSVVYGLLTSDSGNMVYASPTESGAIKYIALAVESSFNKFYADDPSYVMEFFYDEDSNYRGQIMNQTTGTIYEWWIVEKVEELLCSQ